MRVTIVIPTFNRAHLLDRAIRTSLSQAHTQFTVVVIDDASTDGTREVALRYSERQNFCYVKVKRNVGTSKAKNLGILLSDCDAITFHDSDDMFDNMKIELQDRALEMYSGIRDTHRPWDPAQITRNDIAVSKHVFIRLDGRSYEVGWPVSLVDDFFPNVQNTTYPGGLFVLTNPGLYRKGVFYELGGFIESTEEDREMRDRTIAYGFNYCFIDRPLIHKFEEVSSLTVSPRTGFASEIRDKDKASVIRRAIDMMRLDKDDFRKRYSYPIDLEDVELEEISNPSLLKLDGNVPSTSRTKANIMSQMEKFLPRFHRA